MKCSKPKGKDNVIQKLEVIHRYKCNRLECDEEYIGKSARSFGKRLKEHLKTPSPIYDHANTTGHCTKLDNFSIVGRKPLTLTRTIKEAMYIRNNYPSLITNTGKYQLPTYGMKSCSIPLISTSNKPSLPGQQGPLCKAHNTSQQFSTGGPKQCLQPQQLIDLGSCRINILCHTFWHQVPLSA